MALGVVCTATTCHPVEVTTGKGIASSTISRPIGGRSSIEHIGDVATAISPRVTSNAVAPCEGTVGRCIPVKGHGLTILTVVHGMAVCTLALYPRLGGTGDKHGKAKT